MLRSYAADAQGGKGPSVQRRVKGAQLTTVGYQPSADLHEAVADSRGMCKDALRTKGINAGPIDFLIAAACCQHGFPLLTADKDFSRIAGHCDLITLPA